MNEKRGGLGGFGDLAGLDTAGADEDSFDRAFEVKLDSLQVGIEFTQRFPYDFGTGTAGPFDLTAPFIFVAGSDPFFTDETFFGHGKSPFLKT